MPTASLPAFPTWRQRPPEKAKRRRGDHLAGAMLSVQPPQKKRKSNNMHFVHHPSRHGNVYYHPSFRKPTDRRASDRAAFEALTAQIVMKQHHDGTLEPAVVEALLQGVGLL
jgi:hypothetical protein